jgi:hypothetical protein
MATLAAKLRAVKATADFKTRATAQQLANQILGMAGDPTCDLHRMLMKAAATSCTCAVNIDLFGAGEELQNLEFYAILDDILSQQKTHPDLTVRIEHKKVVFKW